MKETPSHNSAQKFSENFKFIDEINHSAILVNGDLSVLFCNSMFRRKIINAEIVTWDELFKLGSNEKVKLQLQQNIQSQIPSAKTNYKFELLDKETIKSFKVKVITITVPSFGNCYLLIFKERKETDSKKFLKSVLNTTQNLVYTYSFSENRITYINKNVALFTSLTNKDITENNLDWSTIIHENDIIKINQHRKKLLQTQDDSVINVTFRFKDINNEWRIFLSRDCVFKRNREGIPTEYLAIATDITDLALAQEQLNEKNLALQNNNTELHSFTSIASHDLKEPLRKIHFFGQLLKNNDIQNLSEDSKKYLEKILYSSNRLQNLIDDLISFTQSDYHKNKFLKINLNKIIASVRNDLADSITETKATITVDNLPSVPILESQFKQLFNNLISNAIKYRNSDIEPLIHISVEETSDIEKNDLKLPDSIPIFKITVEDNGIGFDTIYKEKIFETFQRLHNKDEYSGNGIGLAICKKIMNNHKGLIKAESILGQGSKFHIYLPATQSKTKKRQ
ncbi:ATP-binding protein [Flavobacterium sp. SM2513]|uniref:PAS domain-containing sensor histidine kinase n=1 Tax=Flavobacterium sp. SM2513 TaxID=3424766 RepID=UPI003D7F2A37